MNTDKPEDVIAVPQKQLFDAIIRIHLLWEDTDPESEVDLDFPLNEEIDEALHAAETPIDLYGDFRRESPLLKLRNDTDDFYAACAHYFWNILCDLATPLLRDETLLEAFYHYAEAVRGIAHIDLKRFELVTPAPTPPRLSVVKITSIKNDEPNSP